MDDLTHRVTSKIFHPEATPSSTISIKVSRSSLRSVVNTGLKKTNWFERNLPINISRWENVEAAEHGTDDSVFFVPEHPSVDQLHERTLPTQYIKVNPNEHSDVVRRGEDFEVSFVGMSVAPMDIVGNNEILLCSLTQEGNSTLEQETKDNEDEENDEKLVDTMREDTKSTEQNAKDTTTEDVRTEEIKSEQTSNLDSGKASREPNDIERQKQEALEVYANATDNITTKSELSIPLKAQKKTDMNLLCELPTALTVHPQDVPFLHYDPKVDGHDTGSSPDSFVPVPGSKRVYIQRRGGAKANERDVSMRFTVMEIDKLSEEQLIAIKSLDEIGKSVDKAAVTVPYLKFIAWMLKVANFLGRSALKKVAEPEHVISKDMVFMLADAVENDTNTSENVSTRTSASTIKREQYGNYLRYGYYFFLNTTVDAKLYAQTGASSQSVPLLLRRHGYNAKSAKKNEREFFPMAGVSYVVVKVTRGCSPIDPELRREMKKRHRKRLVRLLKKYTGKLGDAVE